MFRKIKVYNVILWEKNEVTELAKNDNFIKNLFTTWDNNKNPINQCKIIQFPKN